MRALFIGMPRAIFIVALLLVAPGKAIAQPDGKLPAMALGMSPDQVHYLNREFEEDLKSLDAFGGARPADRWSSVIDQRPRLWTLYGRLGVLNFHNDLEPRDRDGVRFSLSRSGPRLTGKVYIGIHREW
jgi:hypothetical protein